MVGSAVLSQVPTAPASSSNNNNPLKRKAKTAKPTNAKKSKRPPLGKLLAASDVKIREDAVESLLDFLAGSGDDEETLGGEAEAIEQSAAAKEPEWDAVKLPNTFREENMKVLWQGCFYCMYMCDKPLPQQKLANQLAEALLSILKNPKLKSKTARIQASLSYLSIFWLTMVREWSNIDKHRVDKYYSLMRRMVNTTFRLLRQTGWDQRAMQEVNRIYNGVGGPIHLQDTKTPISIAYHVIDIYVEELERSLEDQQADADPVPVADLLEPFTEVLAETVSKTSFQRVLDNVFDPVVNEAQATEDAQGKKSKRTDLSEQSLDRALANQKQGVDKEILKRLFNRAAKPSTDEVARKRLYAYVGKKGYAGEDEE